MVETPATVDNALKLPAGVKLRLVQHYGPTIRPWLATAAHRATSTATAWDITLCGFHDAGWTSVLAFGRAGDGQPVMMKLIPSRRRFRSELAALTHWANTAVGEVLRYDHAQHVLMLRAVGGQAGGGPRPADHQVRVATALPPLHASPAPEPSDLPELTNHFAREIRPRLLAIHHRRVLGESLSIDPLIRSSEQALRICQANVVLHADLYDVNVLFDMDGSPVFVDPRGMRGPAVFDWAFWCAFYSRDGLDERLILASRIGGIDRHSILNWVAIVALNGLAHQIKTGDRDGVRQSLGLLRTPALQTHLGGRH